MPGALDHHPAVAREAAVHLRRVLVGDVVRERAAHPQHRPVVRRVAELVVRPADERVHLLAQQVEVDLPVPAVVPATQVLQEEAADGACRAPPRAGPRRPGRGARGPRGPGPASSRCSPRTPAPRSRPSARRRRPRAARPARGVAGRAPSRSCRPSSARPAPPGPRPAAPRPPGRPAGGSRTPPSTASGRGWACRSAAPGGPRRGPWRPGSSSCPGRRVRGRRRRPGRRRRGGSRAVRERSPAQSVSIGR